MPCGVACYSTPAIFHGCFFWFLHHGSVWEVFTSESAVTTHMTSFHSADISSTVFTTFHSLILIAMSIYHCNSPSGTSVILMSWASTVRNIVHKHTKLPFALLPIFFFLVLSGVLVCQLQSSSYPGLVVEWALFLLLETRGEQEVSWGKRHLKKADCMIRCPWTITRSSTSIFSVFAFSSSYCHL